MDGNPDEKITNGCKDEELLEKQIVAGEDEGLAHSKDEDVALFFGDGIIFLICDDFVAANEKDKHEDAYGSLQKPKETDKSILCTVEDSGVRSRNLLLGVHSFKL